VEGGISLKLKLKKCFKWTFLTAGLLALVAWAISGGEHDERFRQTGNIKHGFQGGNWPIQPSNLHQHFYHGGFHLGGFLLSIFLCGAAIIAVASFIRKRKNKCQKVQTGLVQYYSPMEQTNSTNGEFLDQWEKNLTNLKEENKNGNL
jgi:hypothetical protein